MKKHTRKQRIAILAFASISLLSSCASFGNSNQSKPEKSPYLVKSVLHGKASWYSVKTNFGTATASGERFSNDAATAAHKTLPMGTMVRVTNLNNNKSEIVKINDRGPYIKGRIIDVSIGTAEKLGFVNRGVVPTKVEVLHKPETDKEKAEG
ncbi:MAG: septal ring lytic transglycosylase RlpA family protein [Luteolibacter sp.]